MALEPGTPVIESERTRSPVPYVMVGLLVVAVVFSVVSAVVR